MEEICTSDLHTPPLRSVTGSPKCMICTIWKNHTRRMEVGVAWDTHTYQGFVFRSRVNARYSKTLASKASLLLCYVDITSECGHFLSNGPALGWTSHIRPPQPTTPATFSSSTCLQNCLQPFFFLFFSMTINY